jgi:hypothetical protein
LDLDVIEVFIHTKSQVTGEGPGSGGPGNQFNLGVFNEGESDVNGGIVDILEVLVGFEVGQDGGAADRVRHNLGTSVDETLIPHLLKDVPNTFHELEIHGFVVIFEIDPSSESGDDILPFFGKLHDDSSASLVVLRDTDLENIVSGLDTVFLIDFMFNGETVAIPTESSFDVMASLSGISGDDILDSTSADMAVMGKTSSEWGTIVEGIRRQVLGLFKLSLESINFFPILKSLSFQFREIRMLRDSVEFCFSVSRFHKRRYEDLF